MSRSTYAHLFVPSCAIPMILLGVLGKGVNTYADPGVFEGLFGSDSLGRVNGQHLVDEVLCLWSHCVPLWGWELRKYEK